MNQQWATLLCLSTLFCFRKFDERQNNTPFQVTQFYRPKQFKMFQIFPKFCLFFISLFLVFLLYFKKEIREVMCDFFFNQYQVIQSKKMKEQSQQNGFLILIFGVPASGKSTFAISIKKIMPDALLISADKVQSYLKVNKKLPQVQDFQNIRNFYENLEKQEIEKAQFQPSIWKQSRQYIENSIGTLCGKRSLIIEDDFVLRSQRKPFQRIAYENKLLYAQILMDTKYEVCLQNLQKRRKKQMKQFVNEETLKKVYQKLERAEQRYGVNLNVERRQKIKKEQIYEMLRKVKIFENNIEQKSKGEKSEKDLLEIDVRNFIGEIMKLKECQIFENFGMKISKKELSLKCSKWKKQLLAKVQKGKLSDDLKNYIKNNQI